MYWAAALSWHSAARSCRLRSNFTQTLHSLRTFGGIMATVAVNGATLYYKEAGSGEPLILVHGTGFNADVWNKVFDGFAQNYRTIAYDRRGYQRSTGKIGRASCRERV